MSPPADPIPSNSAARLLISDARRGVVPTDVRIDNGLVVEIGHGLGRRAGELVVEAHGGAVLPGLHDHHLHLMAMAAERESLHLGDVSDLAELAARLRAWRCRAPAAAWLRAVGYDDATVGPLDRSGIDSIVADRPVRIQHRSGAMWVLNSAALAVAFPTRELAPHSVELDGHGEPTGRVFGADSLLRLRLPTRVPDLGPVVRRLNEHGVTGVTDATAVAAEHELAPLADAVARGLSLNIGVMGGPGVSGGAPLGLHRVAVKIVLADHALPGLADLTGWFRVAHASGCPVAVHSVTLESLLLALLAWDEAGVARGDRIEHGSVIPLAQASDIARLGLTVVTQPNFIHDHGDRYLATVDAADLPHLYRCATLLAAAVPVGFSTDAPFGGADPWTAIRSAVSRRTRAGALVGIDERIPARAALSRFLTDPRAPGGRARQIRVGTRADLCLLDRPLSDALRRPGSDLVAATVVGGRLVTST